MESKDRSIPAYLGNCDEIDCGHFRWCGDSYWDINTECYCLVNGKSVYLYEADDEHIECPLGYMVVDEDDE